MTGSRPGIRLFVGLGNPGPQYRDNRHNAGFWWLEALAQRLGVGLAPERKYAGLAARANVPGGSVWLLQPQTFMNLCGQSVAALARFYQMAPGQILVVHDELDFAPGTVRLKFGGSHGGHNGLRDIHARLGSSDYWRLRLGIGHPGSRELVTGWVLGDPPAADLQHMEDAIAHSLRASVIDALLSGDMPQATRLIHTPPA